MDIRREVKHKTNNNNSDPPHTIHHQMHFNTMFFSEMFDSATAVNRFIHTKKELRDQICVQP